MKCDTFSSNFHKHHNFYNILLAWQNTYKLDRWPSALLAVNSLQGCRECRLRFAISIPKDKYYTRGEQRRMILFFQVLNYFLCWFASRLWNVYFVKNTLQLPSDHHGRWALCMLWEHRFSRSQTSSPPPFPVVVTVCWNEVVVVKDLINSKKHTCTYFWGFLFGIVVQLFLIIFVSRKRGMDKWKII